MAKRKSGLGRGLGALLNDSAETPVKENTSAAKQPEEREAGIYEIPVSEVEVNPYQPRTDFKQEALEELAESIRVQGIIQPITVRQLNKNSYQLISGERRLQASKLAGLENIPAYVRKADDQQMLEMALIENIQREDLNAIEVALSYQRLLTECDLKQEQLGDRVGKKRSTVNNYLRLLKLPPDIQRALRDGKLSMGHARAILGIEDVALQLQIAQQIMDNELSVRKVEELVRKTLQPETPAKATTEPSYEVVKLQDRLSSHFGTKIKINTDVNNKGEIKIPFISTDDLNRILDILDI
ncbi:MAG: ParB/RepB/Spo0J family partition protein [Cyclobacteriaceae bacterium]